MSAIIDHVQSLALFRDRSFSDLTLTLVDEKDSELGKFALHRAIICPQSTTLNDLCRGSDNLVNETLRLTMEYDAEIFEKAVQFWYTGNYQDEDHHPPLTGVPELAWHMSADELRAALTPSGYRVGTNDLILLGATEEGENDSDYQDEDEESESEEEESESEDGKSETSQNTETDEGEEADNHDSFPTALNSQDKDEESESKEEESESEDDESEMSKDTEMGEGEGEEAHLCYTALTTSIRVFVMAEQFGAPALKLVAKERFYRAVERERELLNDLASPEFLACVDAIYTWPYATVDLTLLKEIVVAFLSSMWDSIPWECPLTTTISKHAELSYALFNYNMVALRHELIDPEEPYLALRHLCRNILPM